MELICNKSTIHVHSPFHQVDYRIGMYQEKLILPVSQRGLFYCRNLYVCAVFPQLCSLAYPTISFTFSCQGLLNKFM